MKKGQRKEYLLRINQELWDDLNEWASQEFRSVNGQIELLLQRAVNERKNKNKSEQTGEDESRNLVKQSG
jgi:hypothetical protein